MNLLQKLAVALGLQEAPRREKVSASNDTGNRMLTRKRQRLQDGFVVSAGMLVPRACTLKDMTPLGGQVEIWDHTVKADLLRGRVTLYIPGDRQEVDCAVMWRRDNALGLKFVSQFRPPTRNYS
ncbi:MAG TPA: hypothetical protein VEA77_06055 [Hyphomicrobium sp.]|nr:hypothetical protein [Hyphomicrobium sp.]